MTDKISITNQDLLVRTPIKPAQVVVMVGAFFVSAFMVYALHHLVMIASNYFGFAPITLQGDAPIRPFMWVLLFLLMVTLFPFFLFLGWMTLFSPSRSILETLPSVTIIIPAFNEQETVEKSIQCALAQNYPEFEVIVVDDGSSDFTPLLIDHPEVRALHLSKNQGKAKAVNQAIAEAKGEYILFSDSDSHLHPDAIRQLIGNFCDPKVGAVSGQLIVRRKTGLVVLWQTIEYIFSQAIVKVAQCGSGSSISVCPGPICMYRRTLLLALGGFKDRTLVEDFDMTLEVIGSGNKTVYEPSAIAWTSTPETLKSLKSQRTRWYRGNLQAVQIYKDMFFNRQFGMLGMFWFPYLVIWGFGGAIIQVLLFASLLFVIAFSDTPLQISGYGLLLFVVFELLSFLQYLFVLALDKNLRWKLVLASLIIKPYNLFLACMHIIAIYRELKNEKITWHS